MTQMQPTAVEQCIVAKAARILVRDDGVVFLEPDINGPLVKIQANGKPYLAEMAAAKPYERKMVDSLVPESFRGAWRLIMAKEDGYALFTPLSQKLPSLADVSSLLQIERQYHQG